MRLLCNILKSLVAFLPASVRFETCAGGREVVAVVEVVVQKNRLVVLVSPVVVCSRTMLSCLGSS